MFLDRLIKNLIRRHNVMEQVLDEVLQGLKACPPISSRLDADSKSVCGSVKRLIQFPKEPIF